MYPLGSGKSSGDTGALTRRQVLGGLTAGGVIGLAGCASTAEDPFGQPRVVDDDRRTRVWEFTDSGASNPAVQLALEQETIPDADRPRVAYSFAATAFEDRGYRHQQITLRLRGSADPGGATPVYVRPLSGEFDSFEVNRERGETVLDLQELDEPGTVQIDFLFGSGAAPPPEGLDFQFEVTVASVGGGSNAVADVRGTRPVVTR